MNDNRYRNGSFEGPQRRLHIARPPTVGSVVLRNYTFVYNRPSIWPDWRHFESGAHKPQHSCMQCEVVVEPYDLAQPDRHILDCE